MLAGIVLTCGVALLAPRTPIDVEAQAKSNAPPAVLKILGLNILEAPRGTSARVTAIVNGRTYLYPSLAGVDWLDVGPTMSSQTFLLPQAPRYEVRFEMELRSSESEMSGRYVSQHTDYVTSIPHTSEYRVYLTRMGEGGVSRSATPGLSVRYSIDPIQ